MKKMRIHGRPHHQRGVASLEFALMFLFGALPLLLICVTGVLILAARESLDLASREGARAAMRYQSNNAARITAAQTEAGSRMQWLLDFSDTDAAQAVQVVLAACPSDASLTCASVTTNYDYDAHPFLPTTATVYGWVIGGNGLSSTSTAQLDLDND